MDRTFKVGDRVRFKTLEQIKEIAIRKYEEYTDDELNSFNYELSFHVSFNDEMKHLCGTEATITDIDGCRIKLTNFEPLKDADYDWTYTTEMVEFMIRFKTEPQNEQISFESLDELKDKLTNLKPKRKVIDIEIKCLNKMYNDYVKDYEEACNDFREFSEYAEECLEGMKKSILEAEKEVTKNESLK